MFSPLVNISKMSDDEIQAKIGQLNKKILHSARSQSNIVQQLQHLLQTYQTELENRKIKKEVQEDPSYKAGVVYDSEDDTSDKDDYDKLIDIN